MAAPRTVAAFRPDQLWQQAREPLFWIDPALRVAWVNRAWEDATGHSAASVVGLTCAPVDSAEAGAGVELAASLAPPPEATLGQACGGLSLLPVAEGARAWMRIEFRPFHDRDGKLLGMLGQLRDRAAPSDVADAPSHRLRARLLELRDQLRRSYDLESLLGTGTTHRRLLEQVRVASATAAPVLVVGEEGTGKRLVSRVIHAVGPLRERPFFSIDCEALPAEVIERELSRLAEPPEEASTMPESRDGAATTVAQDVGSTLLIGDLLHLPRDLQQQLAQIVLESRAVRVIATTTGEPESATREGRLRPDLYHAISVMILRTAPLRERREDLPLLAQHLLERVNHRTGSFCAGFDPRSLAELDAYDWPGNLRELERVLGAAHERARSRAGGQAAIFTIEAADLPASIRGHRGAAYLPPPPETAVKPLDELLTEIERRLIETALSRARQNKSRAAELLGISRPRLYRRIKELNLPDDGETEPESCPAPTPAAY